MKKLCFSVLMLTCINFNAQVGISTPDPKASLDVNGNMMLRTIPKSAVAPAYDFLVVNPANSELQKVSGTLNSSAANTSIAKAEIRNGISLLSLGVFGGFSVIDFAPANIAINPGSNFSAATDNYNVPSTGIYEVTYEFRFGTGVQAALVNLGTRPSIAILKRVGATTSILDDREFSGVTVPLLLSIVISNSTINSIYQLNQNDKLSFGFDNGGIAVGLLGSSFASVKIRKISD